MRYTVRVQPGQLQAVTSGLRGAGITPVGTSLSFIFIDIPPEKVAMVQALYGVAKVTPQQSVGIAAMPVEAKLATFMAMAKKPGGLPGAVRWAQAQDAGAVRTPTSRAAEVMGATVAWDMGVTGKGVKVAVLDSVPSYTPVMVRDQHGIWICSMEQLWCSLPLTAVVTDKGEEVKSVENLEVFGLSTGGYWTDVQHIIRHPYSGPLVRVNTRTALLDVSPNHSLIRSNGHTLHAGSAEVGFQISSPFTQASAEDVARIPQTIGEPSLDNIFIGGEELAWLYGLFAAEGSAYGTSYEKRGGSQQAHRVTLANQNRDLLAKACGIFESYFNTPPILGTERSGMFKAVLSQNRRAYSHFRSGFYTPDGKKQIPRSVLLAPEKVRLAFLRGYDAGDGGHSERHGWEFQNFTTNSAVMAAQLCWLLKTTTGQSFSIHCRDDKPDVVTVSINKGHTWGDFRRIKKLRQLPYEGYLYDMATKEHTFCAGVGFLKTHNTGMDFLSPQLMFVRAPSYVRGDPIGDDQNGHSTHVTTTIAGKTRGALTGLAPGVDILPIKVLGYGIGMGNDEDIIKGMEAAHKWGADIISMSLGGQSSLPPEDDPMCLAVEDLTQAGVIFSIAGGNSGPGDTTIGTPGAAPAAITVGALDEKGILADFSSRGPSWGRIKPDICGVGVNLGSSTTGLIALMQAKDGFKTGYISGTSMATPCVSAVLALWIEYARAHGVTLTADMIKEIFARHGKEKDSATGWGMLHFEWLLKEI